MPNEEIPEPEPIWLALAIIVWALAIALTPPARRRFIDALDRLTAQHADRSKVVALRPAHPQAHGMARAIRVATAWLRRLVEELRTVRD